jgi:hypothetical protein
VRSVSQTVKIPRMPSKHQSPKSVQSIPPCRTKFCRRVAAATFERGRLANSDRAADLVRRSSYRISTSPLDKRGSRGLLFPSFLYYNVHVFLTTPGRFLARIRNRGCAQQQMSDIWRINFLSIRQRHKPQFKASLTARVLKKKDFVCFFDVGPISHGELSRGI